MGLFTYKTYVPHHRETSSSTRVSHHLFKWIKNIDDIFDVWHTIKRILSTITKRREKPETLFGQQETHPQIRPRSLDICAALVGHIVGLLITHSRFLLSKWENDNYKTNEKAEKIHRYEKLGQATYGCLCEVILVAWYLRPLRLMTTPTTATRCLMMF